MSLMMSLSGVRRRGNLYPEGRGWPRYACKAEEAVLAHSHSIGPARAFTLVELLIVLVILSAMVTVTVPYATRSRTGRQLDEACRDVAETVKYALNYATNTRRPARLVLDAVAGSYQIEVASPGDRTHFDPLEDDRAGTRWLGSGVNVAGHEGFSLVERGRYGLVFDPGGVWPQARLSLAVKDQTQTIQMRGRMVDIEDGPP
jgi:prepilin-type N-terminal cleavage/methylation domain-containing protein